MKISKYIIELAMAFSVIVSINFFFFSTDIGFIHVSPHPYWLPILGFGAFYGIRAAWISASAFSLLYLMGYGFQNRESMETLLSFTVLKEPLLFMIFGIILGHITQTLKNTIEEWKSKYTIVKKEEEKLTKEIKVNEAVKNELEHHITTQVSTLTHIYDFAKKLSSFELKSLYQEALKMLVEHLQIDQTSLYLAEHNLLRLETTAHSGQLSYAPPKEVNRSTGIFHIAIQHRKTISIRELFGVMDYETLKQNPLMVVPLFRKDGSLIGVISIEKINFQLYTPTTIKLISLIAEWLSNAIDNALLLQETQKKSILDEQLGLYQYHYFKKRILDEFGRAIKFSLPLSLMLFHVEHEQNIKPESKLPLQHSLSSLIRNIIREIDIPFFYKQSDTWAIVFPLLTPEEADKISSQIIQKISEFSFQPYNNNHELSIKIATAHVSSKIKSVQQFITEAEEKLSDLAGPEKQAIRGNV